MKRGRWAVTSSKVSYAIRYTASTLSVGTSRRFVATHRLGRFWRHSGYTKSVAKVRCDATDPGCVKDEDGGNPLPDETSAQSRYRDGAARARLQSHPRDEYYGHSAADGRDPSIVKIENGSFTASRSLNLFWRNVLKRPRPIADIAGSRIPQCSGLQVDCAGVTVWRFRFCAGTQTLPRNARVRPRQVHPRGSGLCGRSPTAESVRPSFARPPNREYPGGAQIDAVQSARHPRAYRTVAISSPFPSGY